MLSQQDTIEAAPHSDVGRELFPDVEEIAVNAEALAEYREMLLELQQLLVAVSREQTELRRFVDTQLADFVLHALDTCPFYQERDGALREKGFSGLEIFEQMKPLCKRDLQERYTDLWSDAYVDDSLNFWMTSGSTGEATTFVVDHFNALSRDVSYGFTQVLAGNDTLPAHPGETLILRIASAEGTGVWFKELPFCNNARLWKLPVFDHPQCDVGKVIQFIRAEQPPVIGGDPQAFATLIRHWQETFPDEPRYPYPIVSITCGGTQLSAEMRQTMAAFFGIPVTDCYALTETSIVASQCPQGRLHVHAPINWVEVVGDDGCPLPPGEVGELVVTNLLNWCFPFIRYRTGDMGALSWEADCPCGCQLPVITDFQGRKRRMLVTSEGKRVSPNAVVPKLMALPVYQYQLVQQSPASFVFRYSPKAGFSVQHERQVTEALTALMGCGIDVTFESRENLTEPGVKFQDVVSLCHESTV